MSMASTSDIGSGEILIVVLYVLLWLAAESTSGVNMHGIPHPSIWGRMSGPLLMCSQRRRHAPFARMLDGMPSIA